MSSCSISKSGVLYWNSSSRYDRNRGFCLGDRDIFEQCMLCRLRWMRYKGEDRGRGRGLCTVEKGVHVKS